MVIERSAIQGSGFRSALNQFTNLLQSKIVN